MESVCRQILLIAILSVLYQNVRSQNKLPSIEQRFEFNYSVLFGDDEMPVAQNDTLSFCANCDDLSASLNIMTNDSKGHTDGFMVFIKQCPNKGLWELQSNGTFRFTNTNEFLGTLIFSYQLCKIGNHDVADEALIVVNVLKDTDCDGVDDETDVDDDNDGILDFDDGIMVDTDLDSIPNYLDIDSDNDGIPDNIEAQPETNQIQPLYKDSDGDGLDDAYDPDSGGSFVTPVDTDNDGMPDFVDINSDNDKYSDYNEAYDANFDTIPDVTYSYTDSDEDGLDGSFDTVDGWLIDSNSCGHNAPLPDYNSDGIRDWRDADAIKPIPGQDTDLQPSGLFITVYPNPASSYFQLDFPPEILEEETTIRMFSNAGQKVFEIYMEDKNARVNVSNYESGDYLLQIQSESFRYQTRLIIHR